MPPLQRLELAAELRDVAGSSPCAPAHATEATDTSEDHHANHDQTERGKVHQKLPQYPHQNGIEPHLLGSASSDT